MILGSLHLFLGVFGDLNLGQGMLLWETLLFSELLLSSFGYIYKGYYGKLCYFRNFYCRVSGTFIRFTMGNFVIFGTFIVEFRVHL